MLKNVLISRGIVMFPNTKQTIEVGREKSIGALLEADKTDKKLVIVSQKDPQVENPTDKDIYGIGTLCQIVKLTKLVDGTYVAALKGIKRVKINKLILEKQDLYVDYELCKEVNVSIEQCKEKIDLLISMVEKRFTAPTKDGAKQLQAFLESSTSATKLLDTLSNLLPIDFTSKQQLLSEFNVLKRIDLLLKFCSNTNDSQIIDRDINKRINDSLSKQQKEFYLREKMRVVKEELGELNSKEDDINSLKKRVQDNPYPQHIKTRVLQELNRIESTANPQENSITRSFVEWLLDIPWWQTTKDINDIKHVEEILNKSHYGLEKVKERIIEYLAVRARSPKSKSPIVCLVGPPGVGKSTLAKSISEALGKKFVKMSLGGVRDEAEIRGHRKTYLGSMPGRIIKAMKQAGVVNPLFLLDEIDKMTSDMRGDPASAMLEVLDPEQNNRFSDNYIEEYYDLSQVMFVATANFMEQIPAPLHDRLEIIELSSYTEREKLEIAKKYLIPKIFKDSIISEKELSFKDDAIMYIIRHYTREAGVRELERLIQKITRKFIVQQNYDKNKTEVINIENVVKYLKKEIFDYNVKENKNIPGIVNGMAYTTAGGDLLPIEVTHFVGKGNIIITGNLKETMKESASVALGYVKANAKKFGLENIDFKAIDIHIHVPSGGIPKDGPSAGVTLTTAIISALSGRAVSNNIAMTGEITLRGKVLIIGGVREKVISAFRGGVNEIFMPKKDERYIEDVPKEVASQVNFHLIEQYDEIYNFLFNKN